MGAVLAAQFPPLVKNALGADQQVATLFLAIFSIGVAIGSVAVNRLLKGQVSARYSPASALGMGLFVLDLYSPREGLAGARSRAARPVGLPRHAGRLSDHRSTCSASRSPAACSWCRSTPSSPPPCPSRETARTIAANNIVNSGLMVAATLILTVAVLLGVTVADSLLIVAVASVIAAWLGWKLHLACD